MSKIKYLVLPGVVISKSDGDFHYVSAEELMKLYKVDPKECIIQERGRPDLVEGLIELRPSYDGDYRIPHG